MKNKMAFIIIITCIIILFTGCLSMDPDYEQATKVTESENCQSASLSDLEESTKPGYNKDLLSYLTLPDNYEITNYGETTGKNYSYFVYQISQIDSTSKDNDRYWEIIVLDGEQIQTVLQVNGEECGVNTPEPSDMIVECDVNFDGINDVLIHLGTNENQDGVTYKCYLTSKETFKLCSSFSDIVNPSIDKKEQIIRSQWNPSPSSKGYGIYRFSANKFLMTERITVETFPEDQEPLKRTWKDEVWISGNWITRAYVTEEGNFPDQVQQQFYSSHSHWGLDQEWWQTNLVQQIPSASSEPKKDSQSYHTTETNSEISSEDLIQKQIQIISEHTSIWAAPQKDPVYLYTVTDLDQNGRLELIASFTQGSGYYTSSYYYEVNETFDGLNLCKVVVPQGDSEADITEYDVPVYYDSVNDRYHYIFHDVIRDGNGLYYNNKRSISLNDGKLNIQMLAYQTVWHQESSTSITCEDMERNEISEEEYQQMEDMVFSDLTKMKASFFWFSLNNTDWYSQATEITTLTDILIESYNNFQLAS